MSATAAIVCAGFVAFAFIGALLWFGFGVQRKGELGATNTHNGSSYRV